MHNLGPLAILSWCIRRNFKLHVDTEQIFLFFCNLLAGKKKQEVSFMDKQHH